MITTFIKYNETFYQFLYKKSIESPHWHQETAIKREIHQYIRGIPAICIDSLCNCCRNIDGMLPKGPYPPCLRVADRALLTGHPRYMNSFLPVLHQNSLLGRGCPEIRTLGQRPSEYEDGLSWYRDFHYKDDRVVRPSNLYNENPYTGKAVSWYWDGCLIYG